MQNTPSAITPKATSIYFSQPEPSAMQAEGSKGQSEVGTETPAVEPTS